ncbi:antitoxin VapB family protein [Halegenticoccus soli]|uniref:antitoxin VapB family protein n=1 Tax=Halegenticoccus soli TaxID=1985678 RepID=UPI000C6EAC82|nr:antitoxin VapB family protein [Halegenticoccus soli]
MATKTITIREDVYERLASEKREGESFSDLLERLTKTEADPLESAGAWEGTTFGETRDEWRKKFDRDAKERRNALSGH